MSGMGQGAGGGASTLSGGAADASSAFPSGQSDPDQFLNARLVYDGKSYYDWLTVADTERSPTRLLEAVNAILILAPEDNSEEAAGALLRIMRAFGSQTIDSSPQGNLIAQTLNTLQSLSPEGVVKAFAAEISEGNSNSREFLLLLLLDLKRQVDTTTAPIPLVTAFAPAAPQMMSKLLEMSRDTNSHLNRWALLCAGNLAVTLRLDVAKIDGFLPRFSEALQSKDKESAYHAAVVLSSFAPFTEGIAEVLVDNIGTRWDALPSLVRLGPHAAAAVPKLAEILAANAAKAQDAGTGGFPEVVYPAGIGSAFPGMGMGVGYGDIVQSILSIIEQCAPAAEGAVPVLKKLAEKEGPYQERARQLIERFHTTATQPADEGEQPSHGDGQ